LNFGLFSLFLRFVLKNVLGPIADFEIEFVKFKDGIYEFRYEIDEKFFGAFDNSDVKSAAVKVALVLDKQLHMMQVDLIITGSVGMACDRCLEVLGWPVNTRYRLVYKLLEDNQRMGGLAKEEDNVELCFVPPNAISVNVAQAVYESVLLDIPMLRNCDNLDVKPCNFEMLEKLEKMKNNGEAEADPRWDKLKDLLK
jgi:uncharacterized metal-binding protein YceD (DUF177 family)